MRIVSIENFAVTGLGRMRHVMDGRGVEVETVRAYQGEPLPAAHADFDALVILGGAQNALDDAGSPYFPALLELIRDTAARGRHVLGICLGSQLVSRAYGGTNLIGNVFEFGYHTIEPTAAAAGDPLFSGLGLPQSIFEWHEDSATVPPGAVHLASSAMTPAQGFRVGATVYAVQFHLEVTREQLDIWTKGAAEGLDKRLPGWREIHERGLADHYEEALAFCDRFTARWLDMVDGAMP